MKYFFALLGIAASFVLLKYRERVGEMFGEADWMRHVGGIYGIVIIVAIFIFFWSVATLTGTMDIFLIPLAAPFRAITGG